MNGNKKLIIVLSALLISSVYLYVHFPKTDGYYTGADEGVYYKQSKKVMENGLQGFRMNAEEFINNKNLQIFPNPLRITSTLTTAAALSIYDSYATLSFLSLGYFIILCLLTYFYVSKIWDSDIALIATLLLCVSPLGGGMARRALIDSLSYLVVALSFFSFLDYAVHQTKKYFYVFCVMLTVIWLTRETGFLFYPFYLAVLLHLKYRGKLAAGYRDIFSGFAASAAAALFICIFTLGYENAYGVAQAIFRNILLNKDAYVRQYMSGPWYEYFVDLTLLSPLTMILAFLYAGFYLFTGAFDDKKSILLGFFAYTVIVYAFLQKDIRYVMILDLLVRILSAFAILEITKIPKFSLFNKAFLTTLILFVVLAADVRSFTRHFIDNSAYDPVAYNLLYAERFIPITEIGKKAAPFLTTTEIQPKTVDLEAEIYLKAGLAYFKEGQYERSIEMSRKAIQLRPDFASAYNNICASFIGLQNWDEAIKAGTMAVKLDQDNQLAKNNLARARSQKVLSERSEKRDRR